MNTQKPMRSQHAVPTLKSLNVEEVHAESEALFRSIGDGAIATDEFGHVTRINPKALAILDLKPDEALGQWFPRLIPIFGADGQPLPLIDRPIVRVFLTGQPITEKLVYGIKGNRMVPVSITVSPIILDGRPVGAIEVFRDITVENEIDRMKSEFISLASHQLRTPLSTIKTYAHMLKDAYMGSVNKDQAEALKTITRATDSMNELIGTLLNIARIESGSIELTIKRLDAGILVEEVLKQLKPLAEGKNITLDFPTPSKGTITVKTDSLITKEVLTNLVSNSIKYTPENGVVTVTVQEKNHDVLFAIRDNGIGIPKQAQEQIFTKFYRAQNVVRNETTGTGLGLYVVKGLVLILHGKIWFTSEENKGSTFYVTLPKNGTESKSTTDSGRDAEV